jgi:hypothetical protein
MYLYFDQIEELLTIIDRNQSVVGDEFSADFVTEDDRNILLKHGVDFKRLWVRQGKTVFNPFGFAMLAESLRAAEKSNFTYQQLTEFIRKGKYIPPTAKERYISEFITTLPFKELDGYKEGELIKLEIIEGIKEKLTHRQIASNIGHKTGVWNLDGLVSYYQQVCWERATAAEIKKRNLGKDPDVYRWVHKSGCCEHCVRLYLTNGKGSEPIRYKLCELEANGSNEGRKPSEWLPTIFPTHKNCSCSLFEYSEGYLWNPATQRFDVIDPEYKRQTALKRPLIRVWIGGKEHYL